jgi:hypothetical protein
MYMLLNIHFLYKNGKSVPIYKDIAEPGYIREKSISSIYILKAVIKERSITIKYAPHFLYAENFDLLRLNSPKRKIVRTLLNTDQSQRRKHP